jgi:hypothetical protein
MYVSVNTWTTVGTPMVDLLATNGFDVIPWVDDDQAAMNGIIYFISTLR